MKKERKGTKKLEITWMPNDICHRFAPYSLFAASRSGLSKQKYYN
jgi:hypothetical protein